MRSVLRLLSLAAVAAVAAVAGITPSPATAADTSPGIVKVHPLPAGPVSGGGSFFVEVYGPVNERAELWFGDVPGTNQSAGMSNYYCLPAVGIPCNPPPVRSWIVQAKAPAHAAGKVDVTVRVDGEIIAGQTETSDDFVFYEEPRIVSLAARNGPVSGGNIVKVNLEGLFIKDPAVTFGDKTATVVDSVQTGGGPGSATQTISVRAPEGTMDDVVDVKVTGIVDRGVPQWGTAVGATATADDYKYNGFGGELLPNVTSVVGNAYAWLGGIATIRGVRFGNLKFVKVGTRNAFVLSKSSTQVIILAPPLAKGTYPVTVATGTGISDPTDKTTLTYRSLG